MRFGFGRGAGSGADMAEHNWLSTLSFNQHMWQKNSTLRGFRNEIVGDWLEEEGRELNPWWHRSFKLYGTTQLDLKPVSRFSFSLHFNRSSPIFM
ncbi:hypothetical protein SLA2020_204380 [Shorea laevis]